MGSEWVHISPLPVSYSYFEIGENSNHTQTQSNVVGLDEYPWTRVLLPCLLASVKDVEFV